MDTRTASAIANPPTDGKPLPELSEYSLFTRQVMQTLGLIGYRRSKTLIPQHAPPNYFVMEAHLGHNARMRQNIGIIIYDNKKQILSIAQAEQLVTFIKEQAEVGILNGGLQTESGLQINGFLITSEKVSQEVEASLVSPSTPKAYLKAMTYTELVEELINFEDYLHREVHNYIHFRMPERPDEPPLSEVYIPLQAEHRQSLNIIELASVDEANTAYRQIYNVLWQGDLEHAVRTWLSAPKSPRLALLADYGSGKTTFCSHFTAKLAGEYLNAPVSERGKHRIPLLITLRDFARNAVELEGYLVSHLKKYCSVDNPNYQALRKMAEAGLLLFIFDGFDEMALRADAETIRENIAAFEELANLPNNKVLLTTRPEYFMNYSEQTQALRGYHSLYISPFNPGQIEIYLQKRSLYLRPTSNNIYQDLDYFRRKLKEIHDLTDLARRPVLLEMIVKTFPDIVADNMILNRPNLYQRYLEGELNRQTSTKQRRLLISPEKRFEIMERLALELYISDKTELTGKRIADVSKELLTPEQQSEMEAHQRDILTCSFLVRNGNIYHFSHQSFIEYLVARRLARDIAAEKIDFLRTKALTSVIREFLIEMEQSVKPRPTASPNHSNTLIYFNSTILGQWLQEYRTERWTATNLVSLLAGIKKGKGTLRLRLQKANLMQADLSNANLRGAILDQVDLTEANLNETDLSDAFLFAATLLKAQLVKTVLNRANLTWARLVNARLIEAELEEANLTEVNLTDADLSRANLQDANLKDAILEKANLRRANLRGAKMDQTNLTGANLSGANLAGVVLTRANLAGVNWGDIASRGTLWNNSEGLTNCDGLVIKLPRNLAPDVRVELRQGGAEIIG